MRFLRELPTIGKAGEPPDDEISEDKEAAESASDALRLWRDAESLAISISHDALSVPWGHQLTFTARWRERIIGSVWLGTSHCRMWNFSMHSELRTNGHIPIRSRRMQPLPYYLL